MNLALTSSSTLSSTNVTNSASQRLRLRRCHLRQREETDWKVQLAAIDANSKSLSVDHQLPYTVEVIAAGDDDAPVVFKYGDQTWQSGDGTHQSTLEMDLRRDSRWKS